MSSLGHYIVCAAVKTGDHIICGVRHFDMIMRNQIQAAGLQHAEFDQGFVDCNYKFVDRKEALRIAEKAGQVRCKTGNKYELFSEDLY